MSPTAHEDSAVLQRLTPPGIYPPLANYSHATLAPPHARWLVLAGQLGIAADGTVPDTLEGQAELCFENIRAILAEAGMDPADLVRLTTYLTDAGDLAAYMRARDRHVGAPPPASTLLVVQALARPQFKIEIEAIAARID